MSEMLSLLLRNPPLYVIPAIGLLTTFAVLRLKSNYVNHGVFRFSIVTGQSEVDATPETDDVGTEGTIASAAGTAAVTAPPSVKPEERTPLAEESEPRFEPPSRREGRNWFDNARSADAYAYFLKHDFNQNRLLEALDWTWDTVARWSAELTEISERRILDNYARFEERQLWLLIEVRDAWRDVRYAAPDVWGVEKLDRVQYNLVLILRRLTEVTIRPEGEEFPPTREILDVLGALRESLLRFSSYLDLKEVGKRYLTQVPREEK